MILKIIPWSVAYPPETSCGVYKATLEYMTERVLLLAMQIVEQYNPSIVISMVSGKCRTSKYLVEAVWGKRNQQGLT